MCQYHEGAKPAVLPFILPLMAFLALSGCASNGEDAWVNMHQGPYYDRMYTGEDHI